MDNIQYPNTGSSGWGTKINNNFKNISDTIGSINKDSDGDIGTQLGNINSQLNDIKNNIIYPLKTITNKIMNATDTINIGLIGDSIVCGLGGDNYNLNGETIFGDYKANTGDCWANKLKTYLESNYNCSVKNRGIGNKDSNFIVNNLSNLIKDTDNIIFCAIGTNNRDNTDGGIQYYNDLETIYNYCKNKNIDIVFLTCIPKNNFYNYELELDKIANIQMKLCENKKIEFIDMYNEFAKMQDLKNTNLSNLYYDGIHPNNHGYGCMFDIVLEKLGFQNNKTIQSNNVNEVELLSWGSYYAGTKITFKENVNNFKSLIIAMGTTSSTTQSAITVKLIRFPKFYGGTDSSWKLEDGYITFTSETEATINETNMDIRKIVGIKNNY